MSDSYKYIDPDYSYIDPKTGILKNLANISDADALLFFESVVVTKRIQELNKKPIEIKGIESLFFIHKYLFQDVYAWAGKKRVVEISKEGKQFFPTTFFENAFQFINSLIFDYKKIPINNKREIAEKLAEILDNLNYLHSFREGNGPAIREFLRLLALEKKINLNPPDNEKIYERYLQGTINSDVKVLTNLILELIDSQKEN